jgi:hypothetical protein
MCFFSLKWLEKLGEVDQWLADIPPLKVQQFVAQAHSMTAN